MNVRTPRVETITRGTENNILCNCVEGPETTTGHEDHEYGIDISILVTLLPIKQDQKHRGNTGLTLINRSDLLHLKVVNIN